MRVVNSQRLLLLNVGIKALYKEKISNVVKVYIILLFKSLNIIRFLLGVLIQLVKVLRDLE